MNEELVKIDERIAEIPALLEKFKIKEPEDRKFSTSKDILWFVPCVLLIVLAALVGIILLSVMLPLMSIMSEIGG